MADAGSRVRLERSQSPPTGGDANEPPVHSRGEDDGAVGTPVGAAPFLRLANRLKGAAGSVDLFQLAVGEESDEPAVGRPEGIGRSLGALERLRRQAAKRTHVKPPLAVHPDHHHRQPPALRRKRQGRIEIVELGVRRKLERRAQGLRRFGRAPDVANDGD